MMEPKLSPEEVAACSKYLRAEPEDEDGVIAALLAARSYLEGAGVCLPPVDSSRRPLYDLVAHSLALSVYDRRDPVITGPIVSANPILRQMLTQLKLTEAPVSKLDTGVVEGDGDHDGEDP